MKAEIIKEPEVFRPVKVTLTFETKKELELFSDMVSCDVRIPTFLEKERVIGEKDIDTLSSLMYAIYQGINR